MWPTSACLLAVALLAAGCGSAQPKNAAPGPRQVSDAFKGSPPVLVSLHNQANRLLDGGTAAFRARLRALRGYPVVVDKWASWCGNCKVEFPAFQRAAVRYGRQVAFVGIDSGDGPATAAAFLRRFPVTYPSYNDPHSAIADAIQAAVYFPQTVYFNRQGRMVFDHAGAYASASALETDIRRYALR